MNDSNSEDLLELYGRVPSVKSPHDLDQKILSEAKRLAPERSGNFSRGWIPATAAVCVIGLAGLLSRPVFLNQEPPLSVESAALIGERVSDSEAIAQYSRQLRVSEVAISNNAAEKTTLTSIAIEREPGAISSATVERQRFEQDPSSSASLRPSASLIAPRSQRLLNETALDQDDDVEIIAYEEPSVAFAPNPVAATVSEPLSGAAQAPLADENLSESEVIQALEEIEKLLREENFEAARFQLNVLKLRCFDCDIPASVEQRLQTNPDNAGPLN
ncbi:MAG: hypothetical protein HOM55_11220 [Proteobacteria bacterium]|jgi:hypothetical protein|nr:hypothetical protein [Pseudomonadota bacterium]